ncbi:MAG: TIGR00267 family protein [Methanosphaera sp.]|nr:TIGR00267 family protein [Methanosphaera sp.]
MKVTIRQILKDYFAMSRYLALGSLDGILTVLSITLTAAVTAMATGSTSDPMTIGLTGLSGGIAIALSNGYGSYIGEHAEEEKNIRELENRMMLDEWELNDTVIHEEAKYRVFISMITHGSASFMGSFIPSIPFFVCSDIYSAIISTIIISFVLLIALGCYLGSIAKESMSRSAIQIVLVGVLIAIISYMLGG